MDEEKISLDNKYVIKMNKGKGITSEVFLVQEEETNKLYAAKILLHHCPFFDNEIQILNDLKSANIPYIVNIVASGDGEIKRDKKSIKKQYIILEYAQRGDLSKYIVFCEKGLREKHAKLLFSKILKGVKAMHEKGICHRDLKTQNILLDEKYNPKICDFGFATYISDKLKDCLGTKRYAAPEIFEKNKCYNGVKIDIFSLGVILFNIVTGLYSFNEAKYNDPLYKFIKENKYNQFWKKLTQVKNVSEEFKKLFVKMVAFWPKDRPSIDEILNGDWLKEIKELERDEKKLNELELEVYTDFLERETIIMNLIQKRMETEGNNNNEGNNRSSGEDETEYFTDDLIPKKLKPGKNMENYIEIKGSLNPVRFMNTLANKLVNKNENYQIEKCDKKLRFKINVEQADDEENDKENEEEKEDNNEQNEEEENNEIEESNLVIQIDLFMSNDNDYFLRFLKKSGELEDYYKNIKKIYSYINDLI